jgi:hypothetical protein
MRAQRWALLAVLAAGAGCVPESQLRPQSDARTLAGDEAAAMAEAAGVRLVADGDAWRGNPAHLERLLTTVEVRLENHSGRALKVEYAHFTLEGGSRFRYSALPPLSLNTAELSLAPEWGSGGAAPVGLTWGAGWGRHGRGRGWRPGWYDPFWGSPYRPPPGAVACSEPLPTRDMLGKALPQGTLEDGGTMTGFLYFQGVAERESAVTLQARLVDARSGETFGTLNIPFQVRR